MAEHELTCLCNICRSRAEGLSREEALAKLVKGHEAALAKYGYYIHYVMDAGPMGLNAHTHGLVESFGHPDLQIVLPLSTNMVGSLLADAVALIKNGRRFASGEVTGGIVKNYNVKFLAARENGRDVLRIIIPDAAGNLDYDRLSPDFTHQYDALLGD